MARTWLTIKIELLPGSTRSVTGRQDGSTSSGRGTRCRSSQPRSPFGFARWDRSYSYDFKLAEGNNAEARYRKKDGSPVTSSQRDA